jgi:hypothetical protein
VPKKTKRSPPQRQTRRSAPRAAQKIVGEDRSFDSPPPSGPPVGKAIISGGAGSTPASVDGVSVAVERSDDVSVSVAVAVKPQRVARVDVIGAGEIQWGRELANQHKRWQGDKVKESLRTLFPPTGTVPPRDDLSDPDLIQKVLSFLKEHGVHPLPSPDTILREAGRKTRRR